MRINYHLWSFYLCLVCLLLCGYYVFAQSYQLWVLTPPSYIMLTLSIIAFCTGIKGFMQTTGWLKALGSWFTILVSLGLSFLLMVAMIFTSDAKQEILISSSPDQHYKIHLYLTNGGAMTSFGITGELDGPLWFKKTIYTDYKIDHVDAKWLNHHTVNINGKVLNLKRGDSYDFSKDPDWIPEYH